MAIIESDNPAVEKRLTKLVDLVEEGGGGTHSKLVIASMGGGLRISTKEPMGRGKEIIRLSKGVLLPSDQYEVSVKGDEFDVKFPESSTLSDVQKKLTECLIGLYNDTNKVALHKKESFLLAIVKYPSLIKYLMDGRKFPDKITNWIEHAQKGLSASEMEAFLSETFLQTRHLGYSDKRRMTSVSILMPIVDFLNHHWLGSSFSQVQGVRDGDLTVATAQPIENSLECFAFYGVMDAFDTLLRYDFLDVSAPIVRSVPIELEAPEGGKIKVGSATGSLLAKKLTKEIRDLHRFIPRMNINKDTKILTVSHLFVPSGGSPRALRRVLHIVLANIIDKEAYGIEKAEEWVRQAEEIIIDKNAAYYEGLLSLLDAAPLSADDSDGLKAIRTLAKTQLDKLQRYSYPEIQAA